eukprot:scaffold14173_cov110-Skeletonema_dohrnii-CCMP3373.AAC.3
MERRSLRIYDRHGSPVSGNDFQELKKETHMGCLGLGCRVKVPWRQVTETGHKKMPSVKMDNIAYKIDELSSANMDESHANEKKSPVCEDETQPRYSYTSPPPEDVTSGTSSSTTPPPPPARKSIDTLEPPSAESLSTEIQPTLSMPTLLQLRPESIQSATNEGTSFLSLNLRDVNPNEAEETATPKIPRVNLRMRRSNQTHHPVTGDQHRPAAQATKTQQSGEEDGDEEL